MREIKKYRHMDKFSYALGMGIGHNLLSMGAKDLNVEDFSKAISDILEGREPAFSHKEAQEIVNSFFMELQKKANEENIENGKIVLERNKTNPNIKVLESGLQYEILKEGNGKKPSLTDRVQCHYEGSLVNGQVFDSSIKRGEPAVFGVNQVIPGWVEALQLMPEGSKWRLYIPYNLGYGENGAGDLIPPFSTLIFDVELIKVL